MYNPGNRSTSLTLGLWVTVANQAFGLNTTDVFSSCVTGGMNQSSSLSDNAC